ncbi:MAG: trimethylamine methyltransferase family protein, partial [Anaerolineales bacterium]
METYLRVLSEDEKTQVHERTLKILAETGVKVKTKLGRQYLKDAGAQVNENTEIVRYPRTLVEESLHLASKEFTLGARRPGWDLPMNAGECALIADGEGISIIDRNTGEQRPTTFDDWLEATRLIDSLDEVGVYWAMAEGGGGDESIPDSVNYWRHIFSNFSKHVQDASPNAV